MAMTASPDLVAAARDLAPRIRALREQSERERRLPTELVAAFHGLKLFRMFIPADLGGLETDLLTAARVVEQVAIADGAAGWNLMIGSTYGLMAGLLPRDVAHDIYGPARAVVAGALRPTGTARLSDGGYVVNGRWAFASGIQQATYWNAGCIVTDGTTPRRTASGGPEIRMVFFPPADGELIDTWDVSGLRGTGSHDYAVKDLFVPHERTIALEDTPWPSGVLYRTPLQALLDTSMAAVGLGIGRAAIDAFYELAAVKQSSAGSSKPLAERPMLQTSIARAEALLLSARSFLYETAEDVWADVLAGKAPGARQLAIARLARINAVAASCQAAELAFEAGGGSSIYASCPLDRCLRDIRTASQHVSMATANYEVIGRVLLGLPPDRPVNRL
ncbi:MAG: acyl-CoA dehydrogenase family protein [Alphaproteobacteria bacterium]|nr:acyl-CoA dehydrogenase family protein [Alphaproteobacteria bacterium]